MQHSLPPSLADAFADAGRYFQTPIQQFQFFDKYSRFDQALGRRETWVETVDRTVSFLEELVTTNTPAVLDQAVYDRIRRAILEMRSMPSMRLLSMAGPAARRDSTALYNCSFLPVDSVDAFCEALLISMAGCGAGFSVERQYVTQLPRITPQRGAVPSFHVVEDSAEGWAEALRVGMQAWFDGDDVQFNYDFVRPAGAVLRTKGGRASGPEPLRLLLDFTRARILEHQGEQLTTVNAHDIMCMVGNAAVSGGVRRSAMISLFDYDDEAMRTCKNAPDLWETNWQRGNANNSAVWPIEGLTKTEVNALIDEMVDGQRGEPGIFNRKAAVGMLPERRKHFGYINYGTNPCFAPDTLIQTRTGHFPIESLVGKTVELWNGTAWQVVDTFRITGRDQEMLKITLQDGSVLRVTPYHQMILESGERLPADELVLGDKLAGSTAPATHGVHSMPAAYAKGFLLAEGTIRSGIPALDVYAPKHGCIARLESSLGELPAGVVHTNAITEIGTHETDALGRRRVRGLAVRQEELLPWVTTYRHRLLQDAFAWDLDTKVQFLAGLFDGDGTVMDTDHAFGYQLSSIHRSLLLDIQSLLKTIGVRSKLGLMKPGGAKSWPDGHIYNSQDSWRLTIAQESSIHFAQQVSFERLLSFANRSITYHVRPRFNTVVAIEPGDIEEVVYCCTVEGSHSLALTQGIQTGQCGEISLRNHSFCNLSVAVARRGDTFADLLEKVEVATIIGTIQSLATYFPHLRPIWQQNCEEERLLGVDITGQMDCPTVWDPDVMEALRAHAVETNRIWAATLGINQSAAVTCVKPSGNSAQLLDCSSGIHPRWSPYYIRNVRIGVSNPVFKVLQAAGAPMDPENGQERATATTYVVHFPIKAPEGAITRNERTAIEQCQYWLHNKLHWTEHNPSVTITYHPDEVQALKVWIWEHRDLIGGMAFLPSFDAKYEQMPYEEITQAQYEALVQAFPTIDYAHLVQYEQDDLSTAAQEVACLSGQCDL